MYHIHSCQSLFHLPFCEHAEWKQEWGGYKQKQQVPFKRLPFHCCAITFTPFEDPVCTEVNRLTCCSCKPPHSLQRPCSPTPPHRTPVAQCTAFRNALWRWACLCHHITWLVPVWLNYCWQGAHCTERISTCLAALLLAKGADCTERNSACLAALFLVKGAHCTERNSACLAALLLAKGAHCRERNSACLAALLLAKGAHCTERNSACLAALLLAKNAHCTERSSACLAALLLAKGAHCTEREWASESGSGLKVTWSSASAYLVSGLRAYVLPSKHGECIGHCK